MRDDGQFEIVTQKTGLNLIAGAVRCLTFLPCPVVGACLRQFKVSRTTMTILSIKLYTLITIEKKNPSVTFNRSHVSHTSDSQKNTTPEQRDNYDEHTNVQRKMKTKSYGESIFILMFHSDLGQCREMSRHTWSATYSDSLLLSLTIHRVNFGSHS